jgi:cytochrome c biogenesis protein CcmG, thiol:disulfide interchange protein DsbE
MGGRVLCRVGAIMVSLGLLLCGEAAVTGEHLFQAIGMAPLPTTPAPDFTLPGLAGNRVALQDYQGKLVFLNFRATWCIPCREEMSAMEQLHQRFGAQGLAIVALNYQESLDQVKAFVEQHRLSFTALCDHDGAVFRQYTVMRLPTTYLIGRDGSLLARGVEGRN